MLAGGADHTGEFVGTWKVTGLCLVLALSFLARAQPFQSPSAPASSSVTFSGGDGSSVKTAVVVGAKDEISGMRAERQWLREHFPGAGLGTQALLNEGGRMYDRFQLVLPSGEKRDFYFDITSYFGKIGNLS